MEAEGATEGAVNGTAEGAAEGGGEGAADEARLCPPLPDKLVHQLRQMAQLVEKIARRVMELEAAHKTTVARMVELETATSVQRTTQGGIAQVLDGHKRAIGALGGRHNEQEHALVAMRVALEEQRDDLSAVRSLVTQDFLADAVDALGS
tara:strand:- start:944 stop:1393 length:450 start_codon:yes stop_codon:yes gene_type:complete